jgi:hypothetical protein
MEWWNNGIMKKFKHESTKFRKHKVSVFLFFVPSKFSCFRDIFFLFFCVGLWLIVFISTPWK